MSGKYFLLLAVLAMIAIAPLPCFGADSQVGEGWAISPGEIMLDGIRLGETASFEIELANNTDSAIEFHLSTTVPADKKLRPGYEPMPDAGWVTFRQQKVQLAARSQESTGASLSLPADGRWGGRTYECWLTASSDVMGVLQVELNCRLLVSTNAGYVTDRTWLLIGGITGAAIAITGIGYGSRRGFRRWLERLH